MSRIVLVAHKGPNRAQIRMKAPRHGFGYDTRKQLITYRWEEKEGGWYSVMVPIKPKVIHHLRRKPLAITMINH